MSNKRITKKQAKVLGEYFDIDYDVVSFDDWITGLNVELEHGRTDMSKNSRGIKYSTDVTHDDLYLTSLITIRHLQEFPDYYTRLEKMEEQGKKKWKGKKWSITKKKKIK